MSTDAASVAPATGVGRPQMRSRERRRLEVLIPGVLALLTPLPALLRWPLWRNEVASVTVAQRSIGGIFRVLHHTDAPIGLYYLLLHFWLKLGTSDAFARIPSLLLFAGSVVATVVLARETFGGHSGWLAGILLALSPLAIGSAAEARPYPLVMFLTTVSSLLLIRAAADPSARNLRRYTLVAVVAVLAHFFALLVVLAHGAALMRRPAEVRRRFVLPYALIACISAPLIVFAATEQASEVAWIPPQTLHGIESVGSQIAGSFPLLVCITVLALCVIVDQVRRKGDVASDTGWRQQLVLYCMLVPPVLLVAGSVIKPLLVPRYLIETLPMVAVVGAAGIVALRARVGLRVAAGVVVLALSVVAAVSAVHHPYRSEDPKALADTVAALAQPGDVVAFAPAYSRTSFDYYFDQLPASQRAKLDDVALVTNAQHAGNLYATEMSAGQLARALSGRKRIWVVGYGSLRPAPTAKTPEPMIAFEHTPQFATYRVARLLTFGAAHAELLVSS